MDQNNNRKDLSNDSGYQNSLNSQNSLNTNNGANVHKAQNSLNETACENIREIKNDYAPDSVEKPSPKKKKKGLKIVIITAIIVLVVAALAVGGYFAYKAFIAPKNPEEETPTPAVELPNEVDPENMSVIELYPDRDVSKKDLEDFAALIDERAKLLGDNYGIETDDEKITLGIEKTLLGETAAERTSTVELLVSRGNISFGDSGYVGYESPTKDNVSEIAVTEFERTDILSDYRLNMMDERYNQLDAIRVETLYGLEIEFSSNGEDAMEETMEYVYSEPKLTLVHDFNEEYYGNDQKFMGNVFLVEEDDLSAVYVVSPGASYKKNAELMKLIFEQDDMDFGLVMNIVDEPNWDADEKDFGENQVDSMSGETIVAEITPDSFTRSYNSEVDFAEYEKMVKDRLDVLEIDYMFGTTGFDDKTYCVRVSPEDFAPDFFRLIFGEKEISVRSSFDVVSAFGEPEVVDVDGKPAIRMFSYVTLDEIMEQYNIPGNTVYLVVNDVTIASADITNMQDGDDTYLDFDTFLCFGDTVASEEEENILNLVCSVYDDRYIAFTGTFRFRSYGSDGKEETRSLGDIDWKYSAITDMDKQVFAKLSDMGYAVDKLVDERNMLVITVDLPLDDNLPANFINSVKEIYAACNFDGGAYNKIQIVIKDETKDSPADQFRFVIEKDTYDGKMVINDRINGPKFTDYWSEVYDIMNSDSFFTERSY